MTISKAHALIALAAAAALPLTACADPTSTSSSTSGSDTSATTAATTSYDVSKIPTVDEIAALVPDEVKARGTLRNGASADYAPAEFLGDDSQTPQGYDVDINKALAKVMGLSEGTTSHAEFPTIIPALGTKFDVGISSFTITSEREEQANLISYVQVGSAYGVAAGNPKNFDPTNPRQDDRCADRYRAGRLRNRTVGQVRSRRQGQDHDHAARPTDRYHHEGHRRPVRRNLC